MLISISILTIILSALLIYYNWSKNRNVIYLGISLITLASFGLAHDILVNLGDPFLLALIFNHISPVYLIAGPMIFFYVRGTLSDNASFRRWDLLHFIPAFVQLIGVLPWFFKPWSEKMDIAQILIDDITQYQVLSFNSLLSTPVSFILRPLHLLIYVLLSIIMVWRFRPRALRGVEIPEHLVRINYQWMIILLASLLLMTSSYFVFAYEAALGDATTVLKKTLFFQQMSGVFFFCSSALLLVYPEVLYGMPRVKKERIEDSYTSSLTLAEEDQHRSDDDFQLMRDKVLDYLDTHKPYTNFEFSIQQLSTELDIPLNQLSYCINKVMDTKFTELRMRYRVNHAKELLSSGENKKLTIEAIGNMSGFSSRSSFYAAFKEIAGMSPTEYVEQENIK